MGSLDEIENLIYLCAGCHHTFDARVPPWAFLPINLDDFISRERSFHQARAHSASIGIPLSRPDPCDGITTPLQYGRYQIRPNFLHDICFLAQPVKRWFGNPITAILRSAGILAGVQRLDPVTRGGLPEDVARKFQELLFLYGAPPPPLQRLPRTLDLGGGESCAGELPLPPDLADAMDATMASGSLPPADCARDAIGKGTTHHGRGAKDGKLNHAPLPAPSACPVVRRKRRRHDDLPTWVFGPQMTSNKLIAWSMAARENEEEEEGNRRGEWWGEGGGLGGFRKSE